MQSKDIQTVKIATAMQNLQKFYATGKLTIAEAVKGRQLSWYKKHEGHISVASQLSAMLLSLQNSYKVTNGFSMQESFDIADAILDVYWHFTLAEMYLFFEKAKNGYYGKSFNRLDRATIFEWLDKHFEERDAVYVNYLKKQEASKYIGTEQEPASGADIIYELKKRFPDDYQAKPEQTSLREKCTDPKFRAEMVKYNLEQRETGRGISEQDKELLRNHEAKNI